MSGEKGLTERLREFPFFTEIPEKSVQQMARYFRRRCFRKEKALYYQEDAADTAYFVLSGEIRIVKWRVDGTPYLLGRAYPGDWLGLSESVSGTGYLTDAVTETDSELGCVHAANLEVLLGMAAFQSAAIRVLASAYSQLHTHLETRTPDTKITAFLLSLIARFRAPSGDMHSSGVDVTETPGRGYLVTITQESIAAATGLSRETVNRHLHQLQDDGSIRVHRGKIEILDPANLSPGK
jgi:CRP/FNR family cyclic AMP-dependent transcriptional regulator